MIDLEPPKTYEIKKYCYCSVGTLHFSVFYQIFWNWVKLGQNEPKSPNSLTPPLVSNRTPWKGGVNEFGMSWWRRCRNDQSSCTRDLGQERRSSFWLDGEDKNEGLHCQNLVCRLISSHSGTKFATPMNWFDGKLLCSVGMMLRSWSSLCKWLLRKMVSVLQFSALSA